MYSVVLMMALTGSTEVPDLGRRGNGCYGACYGGCYGACYGGACYGGACYGGCYGACYGGARHGIFGGRLRGCYGGCYGGACYGGCYGGACYGVSYSTCYGSGYYSGCYGGYPVVPAKPPEDVKKMPKPDGGEKKPGEVSNLAVAAPATLVVSLPADAKLSVDDNLTSSTNARRVFVTPNLKLGGEYFYTLKAEVVRDGKPIVVEQRVTVRPGEQTQVTLNLPPATTVAAR